MEITTIVKIRLTVRFILSDFNGSINHIVMDKILNIFFTYYQHFQTRKDTGDMFLIV